MEKNQKETFGRRLAALRKEMNITQQKVSQDTNISITTITKYETSARNPSYEDLTTLAKYFNTTTDYLLGLSDTKTLDQNIASVCKCTGLNENAVENIINHINMPGPIFERINKGEIVSTTIFTQQYYDTVKQVLNIILSSNEFWNIVINYSCIPGAFTQISSLNDLNTITRNALSLCGNDMIKELERATQFNQDIDVARYTATKNIEKISDIFDFRVNTPEKEQFIKEINKEVPDNGNDNPQKE